MIDFDPADPDVVKVFYDLSAWTFEQRGELSEALAEVEIPHDWEGHEIVVPEEVEEQMDAIFERLEARFGPFAVPLEADAPSIEYGLDEWSASDRAALTSALVDAQVPHRWEGATIVVAEDAETTVDELLDAIEAGELLDVTDETGRNDPPDGILSILFGDADELARDPLDLRARQDLIELHGVLDPAHPPFAFSQRTWATVLDKVDALVATITSDAADGIGVDEDEETGLVRQADELRTLLRPYV
jgi:hypothetical protein